MKQEHIFKIKIRDKATNEENFIIMGDSYKPFKEHFLNIISIFTEKWVYDDSPKGRGRCLGRILSVEFLEIYGANEKFVSFGGLKMAYEQNYDKHVEEHNKNGDYSACKYLKDITFSKFHVEFLHELLRDCMVKSSEFKCCNNCHHVCLVSNRTFCGNRDASHFSQTINDWHVLVCKHWDEPRRNK